MTLILNGTTGITSPGGDVSVSQALSGNLTFTGTGNRITGDFSNATIANRVAFQTSTANSATIISAAPNGTGVNTLLELYGASDLANSAVLRLACAPFSSEAAIASIIRGTGTYLPMTFYTGGSERVRIDTSGNVGIGTISPITTNARLSLKASGDYDAGLAIGSNASASNWARLDFKNTNAASPAILYQTESGQFNIRTDGAYAIAFETNGGNERMRIGNTGDISIGATVASNTLRYFDIYNSDTGASAGAIQRLITSNVANSGNVSVDIVKYKSGGFIINNNETNAAAFTAFGVGASERMRITSGGNVGIGTAGNATVRLDVSGATNNYAAAFYANTGSGVTAGLNSYGLAIGGNVSGGSAEVNIVYGSAGAGLDFSSYNGTTVTPRMRLDSSGNLLVGTTSVNGRISSVPKSGFAPALTAGTWATDAGVSSSGSFGGGFSWIDGSGGYCAWVDDGGTDFNIAGGLTSNAVANGVFLNGYAATSWSARSDERLKQNLKPITDALNKTCSLRAVTGAYKNFPDEQQAFLLAQDVQKVLPEAVCVADKRSPEQYLGLAYTQVIPLLVAALQELKAEVDSLKAQLQGAA